MGKQSTKCLKQIFTQKSIFALINSVEFNSQFFLCAKFARAGETCSSGNGEHRGAPSDVKPFSYFVPATYIRVHLANASGPPPNTATSPYARIERVKELLSDVEGVPGHCDQCAHTY